mmetsp:Transcript_49912/g.97663  ORF Transcript_49912/g.97663 Transcript_49912/m.97663 type:complete len:224 (+) Transcript_49912:666-1337(+)
MWRPNKYSYLRGVRVRVICVTTFRRYIHPNHGPRRMMVPPRSHRICRRWHLLLFSPSFGAISDRTFLLLNFLRIPRYFRLQNWRSPHECLRLIHLRANRQIIPKMAHLLFSQQTYQISNLASAKIVLRYHLLYQCQHWILFQFLPILYQDFPARLLGTIGPPVIYLLETNFPRSAAERRFSTANTWKAVRYRPPYLTGRRTHKMAGEYRSIAPTERPSTPAWV